MQNYDLMKESNAVSLSFNSFMKMYTYEEAEDYLYKIREYYLKTFKELNIKLEETDYYKAFMADFTIEHFLDDCQFMYNKMKVLPANSNILYEPEIKANCNTIILENGQGFF